MNRSPRKNYTPEFKQQAVELVRLGKSVPEVAQELNIGDGILYAWVKNLKMLLSSGVKVREP